MIQLMVVQEVYRLPCPLSLPCCLLVFLQCGRRLSPDPTTGSVSSRLRLKDASAACPRRPRERTRTRRLRKSRVCVDVTRLD